MLSWLTKNWRRLVLVALGAGAALAGEHTVYRQLYPVATTVVNSIPCTPGEVGPNCPPPVKP